MQVRAADRGGRNLDDRVARIQYLRIGHRLHRRLSFTLPAIRFHFSPRNLVQPGCSTAAAGRLPFGRDRFASLQYLLEAAELLSNQLAWIFAHRHSEQTDCLECVAVIHLYPHNRAASARGVLEIDYATVPDVRSGAGAPGEPFVRDVFLDLSVPLHLDSARSVCRPAGTEISGASHRPQMIDKSRKVFEIAPKSVTFFGRAAHQQARFRSRPGSFCSRFAERAGAPHIQSRDARHRSDRQCIFFPPSLLAARAAPSEARSTASPATRAQSQPAECVVARTPTPATISRTP